MTTSDLYMPYLSAFIFAATGGGTTVPTIGRLDEDAATAAALGIADGLAVRTAAGHAGAPTLAHPRTKGDLETEVERRLAGMPGTKTDRRDVHPKIKVDDSEVAAAHVRVEDYARAVGLSLGSSSLASPPSDLHRRLDPVLDRIEILRRLREVNRGGDVDRAACVDCATLLSAAVREATDILMGNLPPSVPTVASTG